MMSSSHGWPWRLRSETRFSANSSIDVITLNLNASSLWILAITTQLGRQRRLSAEVLLSFLHSRANSQETFDNAHSVQTQLSFQWVPWNWKHSSNWHPYPNDPWELWRREKVAHYMMPFKVRSLQKCQDCQTFSGMETSTSDFRCLRRRSSKKNLIDIFCQSKSFQMRRLKHWQWLNVSGWSWVFNYRTTKRGFL